MRALESRALGNTRHAAVLAREQVLEIDPLEGLARLAVRAIEGDLREGALGLAAGKYPLDVLEQNLLLKRGEGKILDHALQLGEVAVPGVMAQRVERGDGQPPLRAGARLDQQGEHQRGEIRYILGELAQGWQFQCQLAQPRREFGVELVLFAKRA